MRLTIDSNVLIYAADREAGYRHGIAKSLLGYAARVDSFLTLQSLGEFFFASTRKAKLPVHEARGFVDDWREVFTVRAANEEALDLAIQTVQAHRVNFWDAMIVAVAEQAECDILVSEDLQDGRRIGRLTIVNPFVPEMPLLLRQALRLS